MWLHGWYRFVQPPLILSNQIGVGSMEEVDPLIGSFRYYDRYRFVRRTRSPSIFMVTPRPANTSSIVLSRPSLGEEYSSSSLQNIVF